VSQPSPVPTPDRTKPKKATRNRRLCSELVAALATIRDISRGDNADALDRILTTAAAGLACAAKEGFKP
jgi:ABC-type transporter Mla subunit MlaD